MRQRFINLPELLLDFNRGYVRLKVITGVSSFGKTTPTENCTVQNHKVIFLFLLNLDFQYTVINFKPHFANVFVIEIALFGSRDIHSQIYDYFSIKA